MRIISILNHKGGTGKTTTTLNVGKAISILGYRVLLIDLDAQANLSQSLGIEETARTIAHSFDEKSTSLPILSVDKNFHLVPASLDLSGVEPGLYSNFNSYFLLKAMLSKVQDDYDFVLIDCPPSLGIFTQNALIASNEVMITVQSQFLAIKGLDTVYNLITAIKEKLNPSIEVNGLLITQTTHTNLSREVLSMLRMKFKEKVYDTTIRQNVSLAEASISRKDIFSYNPESYGAIDYMNLAKEILQ